MRSCFVSICCGWMPANFIHIHMPAVNFHANIFFPICLISTERCRQQCLYYYQWCIISCTNHCFVKTVWGSLWGYGRCYTISLFNWSMNLLNCYVRQNEVFSNAKQTSFLRVYWFHVRDRQTVMQIIEIICFAKLIRRVTLAVIVGTTRLVHFFRKVSARHSVTLRPDQ